MYCKASLSAATALVLLMRRSDMRIGHLACEYNMLAGKSIPELRACQMFKRSNGAVRTLCGYGNGYENTCCNAA